MNLPNHTFSWSLSLAIHLAAAVLLGWTAGQAVVRSTPARLTFAAVDIALADTDVSVASGANAAAEQQSVPRPEALPRHAEPRPTPPAPEVTAETAPDASVTLPKSDPRPRPPALREASPDEKNPFLSDLDLLAEPAEFEALASAGDPGSGDGTAAGFGAGERQAAARAVIRPVYPVGARRRGEEGRVVIEVTVLTSGRTGDHAVVASSGFAELDRAAENAIRRARFAPATRSGAPVASRIRLTFVFRLRD